MFKIFKPAELVIPDDVASGVQSILTGAAPPEHLQFVSQQGQAPMAQQQQQQQQQKVVAAAPSMMVCGDAMTD